MVFNNPLVPWHNSTPSTSSLLSPSASRQHRHTHTHTHQLTATWSKEGKRERKGERERERERETVCRAANSSPRGGGSIQIARGADQYPRQHGQPGRKER